MILYSIPWVVLIGQAVVGQEEAILHLLPWLLAIVGGPVGLVALVKATFAVWKSVSQTEKQWALIDALRDENTRQDLRINTLEADYRNLVHRIDAHGGAQVTNVVKGYTEMMNERLLPAIDRLAEKLGDP